MQLISPPVEFKQHLIEEAKRLLNNGLNAIAVDEFKRATSPWRDFAKENISEKTLINQIESYKSKGIAVICGAVSGGLEVIDFDLKNDLTGDLYQRYCALIPEDLLAKLHIVKTRSGGYHFYYRCEVIEGNKKLAARPATEKELKDTPHQKQFVLIETRGQGGYVVAPPSEGYAIEQENEIPLISRL
jgi:hypothetical protein